MLQPYICSIKGNPMKQSILTVVILFGLAGAVSVFATEPENSAETNTPGSEASSVVTSDTSRSMADMGMRHQGKCKHCKSHGNKKHGKGHGGMKHGSSHHGKGRHDEEHHDRHAQVVQRLDMIEARLAKIEAMLEILIRR